MDVGDICDADFGERREHYRKQNGAYLFPLNSNDRLMLCASANEQATEEMLDEIHAMLRHLTQEKK